MFLIKEMKKEERPRERLKTQGVSSLSNIELLAIMLRTGTKDQSVLALAHNVLIKLTQLNELREITLEELSQIKGIKMAKASILLAGIELGKRLGQVQKRNVKIREPLDVYHVLSHLSFYDQEHFFAMYLDTKHRMITHECIFIGTLNQTVVHPREVFKKAIKASSEAIILVHNHPSGDSTPSKADIEMTHVFKEVGVLLQIAVLDHIVIGQNEFYSIKEKRKYTL